ncbi:DUF7402 domain-containing protein [Zobellia uliginosa]|uniref:DUF7402 domain-containing protein n=1 Tax=Zobellia uliginosa TaxID=143224 RepID=UPI0026E45FCC|nr:hypothetical protein [Zobellia uliginosa]MDO6518102.1 hypothetical protein [Zobellia uliginosa]
MYIKNHIKAINKITYFHDCSVKNMFRVLFIVFSLNVGLAQKGKDPSKMSFDGFIWPNQTPGECPFEQSMTFKGIYFTGKNSDYYTGDTFYPTWASDGNLYSPFADGTTDGVTSYSADPTSTTGNVVMIGDNPLDLEIRNTSTPQPAKAFPYGGRYPCGSLMYNGIWYYGTYGLGMTKTTVDDGYHFAWPILGPMPGFRISKDYGKTWTASPLSMAEPLFPEPKEIFDPVKIGAPHFVDYGQNMEHSPDGKAYLVGMGAEVNDPMPRFANLSWIAADQVYLTRVIPSVENINDINAYEFFGGHDSNGQPIWTSDFNKIKPLLEWNNHMGCVTVTYNAPLKKYFMCVTDGWRSRSNMDSYILEADKITGPWKMVTYLKEFGTQGYFLNFPSKFISDDGKTMWLSFSGNFGAHTKLPRNPPNGRYGLGLYEVKLLGDEKQQFEATQAWNDPNNLATKAVVTSSPSLKGTTAKSLNNGKVCQQGVDDHWISTGNKEEVWIKLSWDTPKEIRSLRLFNCVNREDIEKYGKIQFSNGREIPIRVPLPNAELDGLDIFWGNKEKVDWIKVIFDRVKPNSANFSLSEIAVFGVDMKDVDAVDVP